jgi:hypothetical protein
VNIPSGQSHKEFLRWNKEHREEMRATVREIAEQQADPIGWLVQQFTQSELRHMIIMAETKKRGLQI